MLRFSLSLKKRGLGCIALGANPSYVNNASVPALQYHSPPLRSAWLNTNPMNSEGSANTPQERLSTQKSCFQTKCHFLAEELQRSGQILDWRAWWWSTVLWETVQSLIWTMWSDKAGWGWDPPGSHEPLLTISCSVREMHTNKETRRHDRWIAVTLG